jgi:hypothetical protein
MEVDRSTSEGKECTMSVPAGGVDGSHTPIVLLVLPIVLLGFTCTNDVDSPEVMMDNAQLERDITTLRQSRIFFGHQSVGWNIIEGLAHVAEPANGLTILEVDSTLSAAGGYLAHSAIGANERPQDKCDAFVAKIDRFGDDALDVVAMKFCFADFTPERDVHELLEYYAASMAKIHLRHPHLRIVHITAPLLRRNSLWKRVAKWMLNRPETSETQNRKVNEFNTLLRDRFPNEPIFDLARVESTEPGGGRCGTDEGTTTVYTVVSDYTSDGGHLNELGSKLAAAEMLHVLADAVQRPAP